MGPYPWITNPSGADHQVLSALPDPEGAGLVIGLPAPDGTQRPITGLRTARARPLDFGDQFVCWYPEADDEFMLMPLGKMGFNDLAAAALWAKHHQAPSLLGTTLGLAYHRLCGPLLDDPAATVETLRDEDGHGPFDLNFDAGL